MPGTKPLVCTVLATGFALAGAARAAAQADGLPACPDTDELITTDVPDYLRIGEALAFTIERESTQGVQQVRVTDPSATGPQDELVRFPEGRFRLRIIRSAPTGIRSVDLAFSWDQNVGKTSACTGSDSYRAIPVVAKDALIGRPKVGRLAGRYRAKYPGERAARWRLNPQCDVFGCKTRLRSSGGLRGTLIPQANGGYVLNRRQRAGYCTVGFASASRRTYGIYLYTRLTLSVARETAEDRLVVRLTGRRLTWYDAPADELDLCNTAPKREVRSVRVRRSAERASSST